MVVSEAVGYLNSSLNNHKSAQRQVCTTVKDTVVIEVYNAANAALSILVTLQMLKWPSLSIESYFRRIRRETSHEVTQVPPTEYRGESWACGRVGTDPC